MPNQTNPVIAGLTEGLRPDIAPESAGTITIDTELLAAAERLRVVQAAERQVDLGEHSLALQARIAKAAERQADALELIAAHFASVIGKGRSAGAPAMSNEPWDMADVNYLRCGDGNRNFGDTQTASNDGE